MALEMKKYKGKIRVAAIADAKAMLEIYAWYVENTSLTFEYDVPSLKEFENRVEKTLEYYPWLVYEEEGRVLGYAYAGKFRTRAAYDWVVETTIYLSREVRGRGIGRELYTKLETILKAQGIVKTIAVITCPADEYSDFHSVQFHKNMGYSSAGRLDFVGYKFGRWYSTITMDKLINEPDRNMQDIRPFPLLL